MYKNHNKKKRKKEKTTKKVISSQKLALNHPLLSEEKSNKAKEKTREAIDKLIRWYYFFL